MKMKKKLIAANWKMNKTRSEASCFTRGIAEKFSDFTAVEIALFPPFTAIDSVINATAGSNITVGAQDVFYEEKGSYTGEVSCAMLLDSGCSTVIAGHSERRHIIGETDEVVASKTGAVLKSGMRVILCVGETEKERESGRAVEVVQSQLAASLGGGVGHKGVTVAYEPIWAIGTGKNAEAAQIEEMHGHIREVLSGIFPQGAESIGVIYGGSVNPQNAGFIVTADGVDGMLVGTASLELESFASIIETVLTD